LNYLGHFYIDFKEGENYYNAGLILPDLCKNLINSKLLPNLNSTYDFESISNGCKQHILRDKQFHNSLFFQNHYSKFYAETKKFQFSTIKNRKWFLAHVMFEMMLDRVLLKHQNTVCGIFYNSLHSVDLSVLKNYFSNFSSDETIVEQYLATYMHFCNAQFIQKYNDNNTFVYSLCRVMQRIGNEPISWQDKLTLNELLLNLENKYFADGLATLIAVKHIFEDK